MDRTSRSRAGAAFGLGACVALLGSLAATPVQAQQAADQPLTEVVVTGSRIARAPGDDGPSPLIIVDRDTIEKSGYSNLQQLLEKLPVNGNGAFSTRGNNQDSSANGAASISLRGLGADATLVLVNGRRVAISAFAESVTTSFVDINSIPVAAIERVEVLKDGASAVYGSDAVAGVVNIVLRKNFDGFEASGVFGVTTEKGYDEKSASVIWGTGSEDANITVILDHFSNSTLENKERGTLGSANQTAQGGEDFRSSRGFPGRFIVNGVTRIDPGCPTDRIAGQTCLFDYGPFNLLAPEAKRTGALLLGHKKLSDNLEVFTEIAAQHNTSIAQGAPTPLDESAGLTVPVTHPNNPFVGATSIDIGRFRTVDAGPRVWHIDTNNLRAVLGLRGSIGGWDWEIAGQRAQSESDQTGSRSDGWVRTDFLQTEINAGRYNPFRGVINSPATIAAITTSLARQGSSSLTTFDSQITGKLFEISGRAVRMAAGLEYRKEDVTDVPDDQFQRGLIFGTEAVSAAASRHNWSAFVEFAVPLLDQLELEVAGRFDDYSDFGNTTNPKVALRWTPTDALAFRASWGTGFRAPSLAQIGLGPSQDSLFFADTFGCADNVTYCAPTDYTIVFSGNPNLQAEESDSLNFGVAWKFADSFNATLDYWDLKQKKKIDRVPFGFLYSQFCNVQNSTVCRRGAALPGDVLGPLQSVNTSFINISEQAATGLDLALTWNGELAGGKLRVGLDYSYLMDFDRVELNATGTGFVTRSLAGEYKYPESRFTLTGDWDRNDWGLRASLSQVGSFEDTPDIDFDGTLDYDRNKSRMVGAFTTLNLQARYSGFTNTVVSLNIDNALDEAPPFAIGDGDVDLYGYVSSQHNPRGRFVSAKVTYKF